MKVGVMVPWLLLAALLGAEVARHTQAAAQGLPPELAARVVPQYCIKSKMDDADAPSAPSGWRRHLG